MELGSHLNAAIKTLLAYQAPLLQHNSQRGILCVGGVQEATKLKQESVPLTAPENLSGESEEEGNKAPELDGQIAEDPEDKTQEENPVMNFFKTLVSDTNQVNQN